MELLPPLLPQPFVVLNDELAPLVPLGTMKLPLLGSGHVVQPFSFEKRAEAAEVAESCQEPG